MKFKFSFANFFKFSRYKHGFSLVEVMVAVGLLGVVSLGVVEISKMTAQTQKKAMSDMSLNQMAYDIQNIFRDPYSCIGNIAGAANITVPPDPANGNPFTNIDTGLALSSITRYNSSGAALQVPYTVSGVGTYTLGNNNVRVGAILVKPKLNAAAMTSDTLYPFLAQITFYIKGAGAQNQMLGTAKIGDEFVTTKIVEFQAFRSNTWGGKVTSCGTDLTSELDAQCAFFGGSVINYGGKKRCSSIEIRASNDDATTATPDDVSIYASTDLHVGRSASISASAEIGDDLTVNPSHAGTQGYLDVKKSDANTKLGHNLIVQNNFNMGGTTLSATQTTTANIGTGAGGTAVNVNIGGTDGHLKVNGGDITWGTGGDKLNADGSIDLSSASNLEPYLKFRNSNQITSHAGSLDLESGGAKLSLSSVPTTDSAITGTILRIVTPTDYTFSAGGLGTMKQAVNKEWFYNALTGAVANTFFDATRADAIINQILNSATGQSNYNLLRTNILSYAVGPDTACPSGKSIQNITFDAGTKKYKVVCQDTPNCTISTSPCSGLYANYLNINNSGFIVQNAGGGLTRLCLNGKCRTNWAQGGNGPNPGECSDEGSGGPFWYVYAIAPNGSVKCRRWGGFP